MSNSKQHIANTIKKYLEDNRHDMLNFLKDMVAIESPSNNKEALHNIIKFLEDKFRSLGFYTIHVKGEKGGGYLYARPLNKEKNSPSQLLLGHCDTVWDLNTLNTMPISESKGKLTGPGVYDMKAGLTEIIFSLSAIKTLKLDVSQTPIVLINSDEEVGSHESTPIIKRLSKVVSRAFILEPPLGVEGKLKTERKGIGRFTVTIKGRATHAGLDPEKGINAIVELAHQVQKLHAMNDFDKGITVNVGLIEGGTSANVVAAASNAVIDVRVYNQKDGDYITKRIHELKPMLDDVELVITGGIGRQPMEKTSRNQQLWKLAQADAKLIGLSLEEASAGGGSDGNTTSLYTATLDGLGTTGDGAHATHEFIYIDKLIERTALLTLLLLEKSTTN
ncbi:MAG: M20 family metallopeptidase [Algibacter sp.]|uniref:M20 family metallopeptidase n=1 Tax=Algibacter sp. TaxID=1872428 RepID=UPI0026165D09|nr:M20 family metallopeptidase [Algibacter sp.]MDG1729479.1 M20 family metallopeptidase [Algibacter sp.]MDG2178665.1 M20 family metallopeptidase [Algibacter sp.]